MPESSGTAKSIDKGKKRFSLWCTASRSRFVSSSKKQKIVHGHDGGTVAVEMETETQKKKKNKSVNEQESSSTDEVEEEKEEKKVVVKKPVKESSCQELSDKEEPKKPVATETTTKKKDDSSGESESEDRSDEEEDVKNRSVESSDDDSSSSEENDSDEGEEPKPSSEKQSVVLTAEKHDDESKKPVEAETKNVITMEEYYKQRRPVMPPRTAGSKVLCMRNLSLSVKESDVVEFFKDAGKIDWVKFWIEGDRFLGFGHVKFDTSEAAQKALKRNGEELIGCAIELYEVEDRSVFDMLTPSSEDKYLFMGNLNPDVKESDIIEFFKDAGKVVSVRLKHEGRDFFAHVQFASSTVAHKAIRRYGQMLLGRRVELVFATERTVWHSSTPSSRKPPRFGVLRGPGYGPTTNRFRCKCTLPGSGRKRDQSRCSSGLRPMV